ncbi:unnamed protein product [Zymoseptoria tritici ST99CH_3D7]|uniref:Rhodopsin domain-containing protein n=1 Tax=Zymoseptoria tritici (strain ST99CH_3D7) TaxID=1276538 RepID=A0A1X7S6Z7_ZYMT9|nr:unnamed protein product [Zymoseptoria tritici ST99CH_3D7]
MKSSLLFIAIGAITTILPVRAEVNLTAAAALPECIVKCGLSVSTKHNCPIGAACSCDLDGPVSKDLAACVTNVHHGCKAWADVLSGLHYQADSCDSPTDRNKQPAVKKTGIALFVLSTLFIIARLASRWPRWGGAGFGRDDGLAVICWLPILALTIAGLISLNLGLGRDLWTLSVSNVKDWAKWFFVSQALYVFGAFFTKLSLVLLYLRIWQESPETRTFRLTCKATGAILMLGGVACILATIFSCHPITNAIRYTNRAGGTCVNRIALAYSVGGINAVLDIVVIALPIPRLSKLTISLRQKMGIISCFLIGFTVTACTVVRLTHLHSLTTILNPTWDFVELNLWSLIEVNCSMISCCMPAMAGFVKRTGRFVTKNAPFVSSGSRGAAIDEFHLEKTIKHSQHSEEFRDVGTPPPAYSQLQV